ncbi:MAG: hypothetical protein ACOC83_01670 [Gemmatimonadota bacterium]
MEIRRHFMIHLGYAKYWRSDDIVGLLPIEEDRGPGRRTEVYVAGRSEPIIASRTESSILEEMAAAPGEEPAEEVRATLKELLAALRQLDPVLRRMLRNEGSFDVGAWIQRLESRTPGESSQDGQEELFPEV